MTVGPDALQWVTADDLALLGDDAPFELIRGELRPVAYKYALDGITTGRFAGEFGVYGRATLLGKVFVSGTGFFAEHHPDTVIATDVMFIRADRLPPREELERDYVRVPPDAIVEVLSPLDRPGQVEEKVLIYLGAGVRLVLVADARRRTIAVRTPDGEVRVLGISDELDGGDVLPGFRVPVARFFD